MANLITTGSIPKGLWPGVKAAFGDTYAEHTPEYDKVFTKVVSDKAYEEYVGTSPFGLAVAKNEGSGLSYDTFRQGFITRMTNTTFALGFQITMEMIEDNKWLPEAPKRAEALAKSFIQTKETQGGLVLTRAFTSTYAGGDGKELCATDHPNKAGGTYSNELTVGADISEASIEQLVVNIMNATDDRGKKILLVPQALVVTPADWFNAQRIVKSVLQNNTGNNAVNVLNMEGVFKKGVVINRYFDAGNGAFFITTDAPEGLIYQERTPLKFGRDNDADTQNVKFFGFERYTFGWGDPRGVYGSVGAA